MILVQKLFPACQNSCKTLPTTFQNISCILVNTYLHLSAMHLLNSFIQVILTQKDSYWWLQGFFFYFMWTVMFAVQGAVCPSIRESLSPAWSNLHEQVAPSCRRRLNVRCVSVEEATYSLRVKFTVHVQGTICPLKQDRSHNCWVTSGNALSNEF